MNCEHFHNVVDAELMSNFIISDRVTFRPESKLMGLWRAHFVFRSITELILESDRNNVILTW